MRILPWMIAALALCATGCAQLARDGGRKGEPVGPLLKPVPATQPLPAPEPGPLLLPPLTLTP